METPRPELTKFEKTIIKWFARSVSLQIATSAVAAGIYLGWKLGSKLSE